MLSLDFFFCKPAWKPRNVGECCGFESQALLKAGLIFLIISFGGGRGAATAR